MGNSFVSPWINKKDYAYIMNHIYANELLGDNWVHNANKMIWNEIFSMIFKIHWPLELKIFLWKMVTKKLHITTRLAR